MRNFRGAIRGECFKFPCRTAVFLRSRRVFLRRTAVFLRSTALFLRNMCVFPRKSVTFLRKSSISTQNMRVSVCRSSISTQNRRVSAQKRWPLWATVHEKASHFYAEARFLRRTCVFLRAEARFLCRTCVFLRRRGGPYGPPYKVLYGKKAGSKNCRGNLLGGVLMATMRCARRHARGHEHQRCQHGVGLLVDYLFCGASLEFCVHLDESNRNRLFYKTVSGNFEIFIHCFKVFSQVSLA